VETVLVCVLTTIVRVFVVDTSGPPIPAGVLSVAVISTANVPALVGVPEIMPVEAFSESPAGNPVAAKV